MSKLDVLIFDYRTAITSSVHGLQWNEAHEVVNFQTLEDVDGTVGGGNWQEFNPKYHRLYIRL